MPVQNEADTTQPIDKYQEETSKKKTSRESLIDLDILDLLDPFGFFTKSLTISRQK